MLNPGPNAAEEFEKYQRSIVPPTRCATAEEVANAALFLASDLLGPKGRNVAGIRNHGPFGRKDF
jgi:NAD(P)-dependent dehydrogenase (short-subunit alcohol dehydrogenase family)